MKITVIALIAVDSRGSSRAASLVHQLSHTSWPLVATPATFGNAGKLRNINEDLLKMLQKCRVPCLIVDSDVIFTRNIEYELEKVVRNIPNNRTVLHLCPGRIYNRQAVQKNPETLWLRHAPERPISSGTDSSGTMYLRAPYPECWYGGPTAMLLRNQRSVYQMMAEIQRNLDTPCDVTFLRAKHNHALVTPLCRENERGTKDLM